MLPIALLGLALFATVHTFANPQQNELNMYIMCKYLHGLLLSLNIQQPFAP